jgi:hypothetical protein
LGESIEKDVDDERKRTAHLPKWPRVLIFDANVYLNLAKVPGNASVFRAVERAVRETKIFNLVLPEPVEAAINAHRQQAIEGHWKLRQDALRNGKTFLADLAPDESSFARVCSDLQSAIDSRKAALPDTVTAMDSLLATAARVPTTPAHCADAVAHFLAKKAPAHERKEKGRQHIAILRDCLIWASVKEQLQTNLVEFVSADTDFTSSTHNERLHEELQAEVSEFRLAFHTLQDFLNEHISKAIRVVPAPPYIEGDLWPSYKQCPVCGSDKIASALIPGPTGFGWGYRQYCPGHGGYVATGEPYDD